jgi:hypothetical protein
VGTPPNCADTVPCTTDFCSESPGKCEHVPQNSACSDGLFCNGAETCSATDGCHDGTPPVCTDGLTCTTDSCDELNGKCGFVPNNAACDDSNFCNGVETCSTTLGCVSGPAPDCNDSVGCTVDACSSVLGACTHTPNHVACQDASYCNGAEACDETAGCLSGNPPCAADTIDCTTDCSEATQSCPYAPDHTLCDANEVCVPSQGGCTTGQSCTTNADCSDNIVCNGVETCASSLCVPGQAVVCDDTIDCTDDSCDEAQSGCVHTANNAACSDADFCTGVETCSLTAGCVPGAVPSCNDSIACTVDTCSTSQGKCTHTPDDLLCTDHVFCNGAETCGATGCATAAPVVCPGDGIDCTVESCSNVLSACVSTPDDTLCADPQLSCVPSQGGCYNACVVGNCQGHLYECADCIDNDGDGVADAKDSQCLGACDNTEDSYFPNMPGANNAPCKADCYFDQDGGSGNDDCYWQHECDPLEVSPDFNPEGNKCEYDPDSSIPGYTGTCETAFATQSQDCLDYCLPLTPNGCDCFGCCSIPGAATTVWLGSLVNKVPTCTINSVSDPTLCKPCTVVPSC